MTEAVSAFETDPHPRDLLRSDDKRHYQRIFETQAARSYLYLSLGIGLIAVLLPVLLVIFGGYRAHDSISSFYHDTVGPTRDIMVGSLCAVGVFLFLFHGLSRLENWLLNIAGIAIIAVALIPSPGNTNYGSTLLHRGFAILFFLLIGIVAIFLSKGRIKDIVSERKKHWFAGAYNVVGIAMIVMPLVAAFVPSGHSVLLAEWAGIWSFSAYWFLKTAEYRLLLRIRWTERHPFTRT
jgi:ABC-type spermidine/putrescine transport system permease subunit II